MPENKDLPIVEFPEKIRFREKPTTEFFDSSNTIKVTTIQHPPKNYKNICYEMIMSTWADSPDEYSAEKYDKKEIAKVFNDLLSGKTLPNSLEAFIFTFKIEGLTHIEWSHIFRTKWMGTHSECTGDRFLTHDSAFIPSSINNSRFANKYKKLTQDCKELYQEMVDSKEISLMEARYILTRNHRYFIYVTNSLRELIHYINQRKCTSVQPETDNIIAEQMYNEIIKYIPEVKEHLSLKCNKNCHSITSDIKKNTRLYQPDNNHSKFYEYNSKNFLYNKKRCEMGILKTIQDE